MRTHETTTTEANELRQKLMRLNDSALAARLKGNGELERTFLREAAPIREWIKEMGA